MPDDLSLATERVRQNRAARQAAADVTRGQQATQASREAGVIVVGDRVFDSISGLYGDVLFVAQQSRPLPAVVTVRLADDTIVARRPVDLVLRPQAPA
jgi:hypothetical protein